MNEMELPPEDHSLIMVMGKTGVGKSYFIDHITGQKVIQGHTLESCTKNISWYTIKDQKISLIDTHGFDDTYLSDDQVLIKFAEWLNNLYKSGRKLNGVVYLHSIKDDKMYGSSVKNFNMFKSISGKECYDNTILSTTKWGQINKEVGENREQQILSQFWADVISEGSHYFRYDDDLTMLDCIIKLSQKGKIVLQLQDELKQGKYLGNTSAGKLIISDLNHFVELHKKQLTRIKEDITEALKEKDQELLNWCQEEENRIHKMLDDINNSLIKLISNQH